MRRFRRLFLLATALGYAFLGGGPSLWALGLGQAPAIGAACAGMGCTCKLEARAQGKKCCCRMTAKLLKKFPDLVLPMAAPAPHGEMRQQACDPSAANNGHQGLPSMQPHTLVRVDLTPSLSADCDGGLRSDTFRSYAPEPPTPVPD